MEFLYFLIRRALWSLLVLFGLSIVIFVIARVMPGDPARMAMGPRASQEQVDDLKRKMGLDKPLIEQYQHFIVGLSRGDLGLSFLTKRPVDDDIAETFAATFELVLATIAIAFLVGVPLGVVAAANKDGWVDNLVRLVAIFGAVTPSFLLALLASGAGWLRPPCLADDRAAFARCANPAQHHRIVDDRYIADDRQSRRLCRRPQASACCRASRFARRRSARSRASRAPR